MVKVKKENQEGKKICVKPRRIISKAVKKTTVEKFVDKLSKSPKEGLSLEKKLEVIAQM